MEYKNTLLMPETAFEMKANLTNKEKSFRENFRKNKIYQKILEKNKGNKAFILHDGPPYANGNLHVGHALNKILKDIIVRRKNLEGFYSPFKPGWDTHGLPIENKMLEELQKNKDDIDKIELRKKATSYALRQIDIQKNQFSQMQLLSDFDSKYITLDKKYEAKQLELFKKMALDGLIYKGLKPVYWSPSSQSALAEAEIEYKEHMSPEVIVAFEISKGNDFLDSGDNLLIMTTTPWTLIANSGVSVHKDFDYDIVEVNNKKYVITSNLTKEVSVKVKWENFKIIKTVKGRDLIGVTYTCPIKKDMQAPVVFGHHVSDESGTGLVHMAPLFGEDDYIIGKENQLEMIMHVDGKGFLNEFADEFAGKFYQDANKDIGLKLDKEGKLLSLKFVKHSYPHDWRTNKPVIYRGVPQWFVNIKSIKPKILSELKKIKTFPEWGNARLSKMMENRDEWTISRQRTWGVPIIIFYDENNKPIIKEEIFDYVINLVEQHGADIWWEKSVDELLPEQFKNKGYTKEEDIMDVWFDSGSSSIAVDVEGHKAPFDLYLEGSDQYRGWFNSSLINSIAFKGVPPFKTIISHGFVLDGKQEKMSKSKGNVVDPLDIINKNGADVLRLWVANSEYTSDVTISDDIIKQNIEIYRRIRNTIRFMLGNIKDFDIKKDSKTLKGIHLHINNKVKLFENNINNYFDEYNFKDIVKETNKFLIDLSSWYFSYAKDVLYCDSEDSNERRMIQTNIFKILNVVLYALAPILPTTIEEAYQFIPNYKKEESIFLSSFKVDRHNVVFDKFWEEFENKTKLNVNLLIEKEIKNGKVKRSNELLLEVPTGFEKYISKEEYAKYMLVAKVEVKKEFSAKGFESIKCQRCWNHFMEQEIKNNICERCNSVLRL